MKRRRFVFKFLCFTLEVETGSEQLAKTLLALGFMENPARGGIL